MKYRWLVDYFTFDEYENHSPYKSTFPDITNLKLDNLLYNSTSPEQIIINLN